MTDLADAVRMKAQNGLLLEQNRMRMVDVRNSLYDAVLAYLREIDESPATIHDIQVRDSEERPLCRELVVPFLKR